MSQAFFFDTSALIKLYHQEVGTEQVEGIFGQTENSIIISELAIPNSPSLSCTPR